MPCVYENSFIIIFKMISHEFSISTNELAIIEFRQLIYQFETHPNGFPTYPSNWNVESLHSKNFSSFLRTN